MALALALFWLQTLQSLPPAAQKLLNRVAEEAEVLRQNARRALTEETLRQRAVQPPSRFRSRTGQPASSRLPTVRTREIVSEYSVATLTESGTERLMEFRQVVSVDGRAIQTPEKARHALTLGLASKEDRIRKRMLEDFEHHGLVGAVTDFGLLVLMFTPRELANFEFSVAGRSMIGADAALVFNYQQRSGEPAVLDYFGRKATRYPLQGQLFVRATDGLPLRLTCAIRRQERGRLFEDRAAVDYAMGTHGFVAPVSVVHRSYTDGQLTVENHFTYAPFKTFGADTEIRFTEAPEPPSDPPSKP